MSARMLSFQRVSRFGFRTRILLLALLAVFAASALRAASAGPLLKPASALPPQKTVLVFGQKIAYYDVGTGPTIVLVHGFASQARFDWGNVMLPLSAHHRVLALDQIGWGHSDKPAIDYSIQTFVDFLGEFLRVMKVDHFTLAGESLGGWIAADYTIQALAPANIGAYAVPKPDKLILEDAAGHKSLHGNGPAHVQGTLADAAGIAIVFYNKSRVTPEFVRESWSMKLEANDGNTQRSVWNNPALDTETVGDKLDQITIPTLVVWGAEDQLVPLADGQDYAAKIPHAQLVVIPESGHSPADEQPDAFLAAVNRFLQ
jgi:pimeloyl-ACP methyl ester carboxylesterase